MKGSKNKKAAGADIPRPENTTQSSSLRGNNVGSTIIAVLVALVFIGIVVGAMLRNTGSQSGVSVGYGVMSTMASTVKSGMVATESYFEKTDSAGTLGLIVQALNASNSSPQKKPFIFSKGTPLAGNQYFSSRLDTIYGKDTLTARSRFEIKSGKSPNGKALKTALAFYDMNVKIKNTAKYGAKNAIYMKGDLKDGNAGMEVIGPATFEGSVRFQNVPRVFHDNVYFNDTVYFLSGAAGTFSGNTYFNKYVDAQGIGSGDLFQGKVAFNRDFSAPNKTINFNGDVWMNGNIGNNAGDVKFKSNDSSYNFFYTDKIPMEKTAMGCKVTDMCTSPAYTGCTPGTTNCCIHGCHHPVQQSTRITDFGNLNDLSAYIGHNIDTTAMLNALGMTPLEERRDPQLDISKATNGTSKVYTLTEIMQEATGNTNTNALTAAILDTAYARAKQAGNLYEDHIVVKLNASTNLSSNPPLDSKFDGKVIFVLEGSNTLGGSYFPTTSNSSTLIHVGGQARLDQFNLTGAFHGLIYIDSLNTASSSVNIGAGDTLVGAFHSFSNKPLTWNTNGATPGVIQYNEDVLNKYGSLIKGSTQNTWNAQYTDVVNQRIHLKPLGFYFY